MAIKKDQGNNIQEQSYQIIERDYERGTLALASPTGTGKTYGGFQYMVHTDKKCFFVTPQWKNLSISDGWVAEAARCHRTWGMVRSNLDCMERYFWDDYDDGQGNRWFSDDDITFQERKKIVERGIFDFAQKSKNNGKIIESAFARLKEAMKNYHWIYQTWQTTHSTYYQDDLKDKKAKAGRAEYAFRNAILREFRDRYSTPKRRGKALEDEEKWIGVLYPYVHVRKWDIVFLMAIRFVLPFNDFIGNTRSFFNYKDIPGNRPLLEDSTVLLDESPQIYKIWFQYLTQEPVPVDMLKTLRSVHTALNDDRWKDPAQGRDMNSFQDFQDKTNSVFNKFQGSKEFKREKSRNREITFSNGPKVEAGFSIQNKPQSAPNYYNVVLGEYRNTLSLTRPKRETGIIGYPLETMLNELRSWWNWLLNFVNRQALARMEKTGNDFLAEIDTVIDQLDIPVPQNREEDVFSDGEDYQGSIKDDIRNHLFLPKPGYYFSTTETELDQTSYSSGMQIYTMEDYPGHDTRTVLQTQTIPCLPEAILKEISQHSLVFCISATAEFNTAFQNFSQWYLDCYCNLIHPPEDGEFMRLRKKLLEDEYEGFKKCHICVETVHEADGEERREGIFKNQIERIDDRSSKAVLTEALNREILSVIQSANQLSDHEKQLLYRLTLVFSEFCHKDKCISGVFFTPRGWAAEKENRKEFSQIIDTCFSKVLLPLPMFVEEHCKAENHVEQEMEIIRHMEDYVGFVEGNSNYQEKVDTAKAKWETGEKYALFISLYTGGVSVNMDHPVSDEIISELAQVRNEVYRDNNGKYHKDFDFLYVDYITNIIPGADSCLSHVGALIESLYSNFAISSIEAEKARQAFVNGQYSLIRGEGNRWFRNYWNPLNNTADFRLAVTDTFFQILGRNTRAPFRNPETVIVLNDKLLDNLEYEQTKSYTLGALSKEVMQQCGKTHLEQNKTRNVNGLRKFENTYRDYIRAEEYSSQHIMRVNQILNDIWNKNGKSGTLETRKDEYKRLTYNDELLLGFSQANDFTELERLGTDVADYAKKHLFVPRPYFQSPEETTYWVGYYRKGEYHLAINLIDQVCYSEDPLVKLKAVSSQKNMIRLTLDDSRGHFNTMMMNPRIKWFFEEVKHWPTRGYGTGRYILCPKADEERVGVLGEVTLYILTKYELEPNVTLSQMRDLETFEFFDYEIPNTNIALDAKNWNHFANKVEDWQRNDIEDVVNKAMKAGKKHIVIANVLETDKTQRSPYLLKPENPKWDGDILLIPSMLNEDGSWNIEAKGEMEAYICGNY